jgi:hypothetical protein
MSEETQIALITAISGLLIALVPLLVQRLRLNGMRITEEQERMVYDAIREGAAYAEEIAKRETMTGPEKLALASRHASNVLKQVGVKRDVSALSPRIESALSDVRARESRLSMPPEFK